MARSSTATLARTHRLASPGEPMHCGQRADFSMRHRCSSGPVLRQPRVHSAGAARPLSVLLSLGLLLLISVDVLHGGAAAEPAFTPRELAAVRLNIIDILGKDPNLP